MNSHDDEILQEKSTFHPASVYRQGNIVVKETGSWAPTVHLLLRHLEKVGFSGAPRVVGPGFDEQGRETLSFIEGAFVHPKPWSREACFEVGVLLRQLHQATASFQPPGRGPWQPWFGRSLGSPSIIGHCDVAPWNIVVRQARPFALIDWEFAGPVDPLVDLAQACWLNAQLHDDMVAELNGLPPLAERAPQLRALVDGYALSKPQRVGFLEKIIEFIIFSTANEANVAQIKIDTALNTLDEQVPWAIAWRARAAAWVTKNRIFLQNALG